MSFCVKDIEAEKKEVKLPNTMIIINDNGDKSNIGDNLIIRNTPAVTIVAACIKADTGVGPSIASGSHICNPICADFPTTPIIRNIVISSIV